MKDPMMPCFRHINNISGIFRGNRQTDRQIEGQTDTQTERVS